MAWFRKQLKTHGLVMFPGTLRPKPHEFEGLAATGVEMQLDKSVREDWLMTWRHRDWGAVQVASLSKLARPPDSMITFAPQLSSEQKDAILAARAPVFFRMLTSQEHVLRDRKNLLRFMRAAVGADGLVAIDLGAWLPWTREDLDDELAHDGDLDVSALYSIHAVREDNGGRPAWMHTHGLALAGGFDFDILKPAAMLGTFSGVDVFRAMAYAILEGRVGRSTARFKLAYPDGNVRLVDAGEFDARAKPEDRGLRLNASEDHVADRAVLCEPGRGLFGRYFDQIRPSVFLSQRISDEGMLDFSEQATALMAERARKTYPVLQRLHEEFGEFHFPCVIKLAFQRMDALASMSTCGSLFTRHLMSTSTPLSKASRSPSAGCGVDNALCTSLGR